MLDITYNFLTTVPVANPILKSLIMLAEILAVGFALYWMWELVPKIPGLISKVSNRFSAAGREKAPAGAPESEQFAGLRSDLMP